MQALAIVTLLAAGGVPELVAHRGDSAAAPENTVAAFRAAWRAGADAIENDWRLSRDGLIVCLHDATVDRTTDGKGPVAALSLEQIRGLDAGRWKGERWKGERVPTLAEVLAVVPAGKRAFLDVKVGPEILPVLKKEIERSGVPPDRVAIIAFNGKVIAAAKRAMPQLKAYWLYRFQRSEAQWSATQDEVMARLLASKADGLDVELTAESAEMVNADLAQKLRAAGRELLVWTVDEPDLARRARDLGARAITTNKPSALRAALTQTKR
jgi:glycerophosphoryl diester phosphodiesterase